MGTLAQRSIFAAIALVLVTATMTPAPSRSQAPSLETFEGRWVFTRSESDLQGLATAINLVADQINFFIREISRSEMHRRIQPEGHVRVVVGNGGRVSLGIDEWGPIPFELGSPTRTLRGRDGSDARMRLTYRGGRLVHHESVSGGSRTNIFTVNAAGTRLTMQARIAAHQLPADVLYHLTYRRVR